MKALVQRVSEARVEVDGNCVGEIGAGLLILLGVAAEDSHENTVRLMDKCLAYRIFPDEQGKMNRSLLDAGAEVLLVSQFTLCADTAKGLRPSFSKAGAPELARALYQQAADYLESKLGRVQTGQFAANMQVHLVNDGPVTFLLES